MRDEYSLENNALSIFETRTKEYFDEVLSSYTSGNYRSAVVMLWSVAICDMLFKLQNLMDLYGDKNAKDILDEIDALQKQNDRSPVWETKLLDLVSEKTQILEVSDQENLAHLQKQRHLAAHPIIKSNFELHRPNRETTRALIRNTLDGLLTKAPILSKKIVNDLAEDLDRESEVLIDESKLRSYLESKYFSRFNLQVDQAVFKALWKFIFRISDEKCDKNRLINFRTFKILFSRNPHQFLQFVKDDPEYFSSIASRGDQIIYLIHFLSIEPKCFPFLENHARAVIEHTAETDTAAGCLAWFLSSNLDDHANKIEKKIQDSLSEIDVTLWSAIKDISDAGEWKKHFLNLTSVYYTCSGSFDTADERFQSSIKPFLSDFNINDLENLIVKIESNDQVWARSRAYGDHREIRERAIQLNPAFDLTKFSTFNKHLD